MPTKESKRAAKALKRTNARQRDLEEMRSKLQVGAESKGAPELPPASVRFRKNLKNRTNL
jgi:hypothetical protein